MAKPSNRVYDSHAPVEDGRLGVGFNDLLDGSAYLPTNPLLLSAVLIHPFSYDFKALVSPEAVLFGQTASVNFIN